MWRELAQRWRQGRATLRYPRGAAPALPARFRGRPRIDAARCEDGCRQCADACPTEAITIGAEGPTVDLGRCLFCPACAEACPAGAIAYGRDARLAVRRRDDLRLGPDRELELAGALERELLRVVGRALRLRVVSAGDCNGCLADVNVLTTVVWDIGRFGIEYVASPRHADGLLIVGPVTRNMELALRQTWEAVPAPRLVLAVGACAIAGGPFYAQAEQLGGAAAVVPVDLYVPGCPPHPLTILDGLLRLLGRLPGR
jgi:Ni,Fe-hydrogenase III small subunit/formate hydrogenlyase subunit 6/NADH:ubiquinone oxidoreductase subunit I